MVDEIVPALSTAPRMQKGKLTLADLGAPALVKTLPAEKKPQGRYYVGRILGRAVDFLERSNPKEPEEKFEGLRGNFIMQPSADGMEELESGVLFLPDAFHNLVAQPLRIAQKTDANATLEFALDVFSIEAKNPAGYSWTMQPALPPEGKHPLADLAGRVIAAQKALAAAPQQKRIAAAGAR